MKSTMIGIAGFILGVASGSLAMWKYLDKKYTDRANEEIESVVSAFKKYSNVVNEPVDNIVVELDGEEEVNTIDYSSIYKKQKPKKTTTRAKEKRPYLISENEYGQIDDFDTISLLYYEKDDMLVDEFDEPIDHSDATICWKEFDSAIVDHDVVYVRNEKLKVDYEITKDLRSYREVVEGR